MLLICVGSAWKKALAARACEMFHSLSLAFALATIFPSTAFVARAQANATSPPAPTIEQNAPKPSATKPTEDDRVRKTPVPSATAATSEPASTTEPAASSAKAKGKIALSPEKAQAVRVPRFDRSPVIDGRLDDEVWRQAVILKDFIQTQPGDNIQPSKPTEVLIGYDAKNLYFGFHAYDDPTKVRATIAKRDNVFGEDNVRIFLDTFNDRRRAYVLGFNPLGVQQDGIMSEGGGNLGGGDTDYSVDILMESKGVITNDGYTVEVAIPFKSLRYEAGKGKLWGFHVWRNIDRFNDEIDSWMPISRDVASLLNQEGHLAGLENISTTRTLEFIPSLTLSETGKRVRALPLPRISPNDPLILDPGRFLNQPIKLDPGLTAKFGLSPTITLDLAVNPDFAQVEADQTVVTANQRFPIFFPEKRPFFLEGVDIFQTPIQAVNTRAIVDPDVAVKLTGKRGRNSFGLLLASDNAPGNYSEEERNDPQLLPSIKKFLDKKAYIGVLRLKRDVGEDSQIGFIATSYNFIEKHNQLGGFDGRFRLDPQTTFSFQVLGTTSRRYFYTGNAFRYYYSYDKTGRNFGYAFTGTGQTRFYRADVGFTQRTNTNRENFFLRFSNDPKPKARIISWRLTNQVSTQFDWQGREQGWFVEPNLSLRLQRQTQIGGGVHIGYERLFEEEFGARRTQTRRGAFAGPDSERSTYNAGVFLYGAANPNKKYSFNAEVVYAFNEFDLDFGAGPRFPRVSVAALTDPSALLDPGPGRFLEIDAGASYQPTDALKFSLDYTKNRLVRNDTKRTAFDDNIFSLRTTYQFTRFVFARGRVDYDTLVRKVRAQFLLGWTPNPGTSLYIGYNDDLNCSGFNPFTDQLEPGFRRNGRTFFIKMSYLIRRSIG
jgi:hypothetical protein